MNASAGEKLGLIWSSYEDNKIGFRADISDEECHSSTFTGSQIPDGKNSFTKALVLIKMMIRRKHIGSPDSMLKLFNIHKLMLV